MNKYFMSSWYTEKMDTEPHLIRLGRAMFGTYNHHSEGLAHNGKACPTWVEIKNREHEKAGRPRARWTELDPEPGGVCAHWMYTAAVSVLADDWAIRADAIELQHMHSKVFQRLIG